MPMVSRKDRYVVFTTNNARVLVKPDKELTAKIKSNGNYLKNPSFEAVRTTPPHFWVKSGKDLLPMTQEQRLERIKYVDNLGADNYLWSRMDKSLVRRVRYASESRGHIPIILAVCIFIGFLLGKLI